MNTCLLPACDIYTLMCVNSYSVYDVLSLLYVSYIESDLSLSGGFNNITAVKAVNPVADITVI